MSVESVCEVCGRTVGLVSSFRVPGEPPIYKLSAHASQPLGLDGGRRPRCGGSGIAVPPVMVLQGTTPRARKARERQAAVEARDRARGTESAA